MPHASQNTRRRPHGTGYLRTFFDTVNVNDNIADTQLHKIIVIYRGVEMAECEEITADPKTILK